MPGIIVGMDGSGHSQRALRRAIKEAAIHNAPLTVITVHQAVIGYAGGPMTYPGDPAETERAREAAQAETDKALAEVGEPRPESVTVKAVHGIPADVLINACQDADMVVLGTTAPAASARADGVGGQQGHPSRCPARSSSSRRRTR